MNRAQFACLTLLLVFSAAACGDPETPARDRIAEDPATARPATTDASDAPAQDERLSLEYLEGEWCSTQPAQPSESGMTYIFTADGNYQYGKRGTLAEGPGTETFLRSSSEVVSVEPDAFVLSQVGTKIRFDRGPCPE